MTPTIKIDRITDSFSSSFRLRVSVPSMEQPCASEAEAKRVAAEWLRQLASECVYVAEETEPSEEEGP